MQAKRILTFVFSLLLLTIMGCGGGSGSKSNGPDPDPNNPTDPGPPDSDLEITVSGLVAELTVTWRGQTIVLNPDRLNATVQAVGPAGAPPEYTGPRYQNCAEHELVETDSGYRLAVTCAEPDRLQLLVSIVGLRGALGVQWFDQDEGYNRDVNDAVIEARPGVLVEPSITTVPELQNCTGEFVPTDRPLTFTYSIECTERVVVNHILIDGALPYPVTLVATGQEALMVQQESTRFPASNSPLDVVSIADVGGTQRCGLEKLAPGDNRDEQRWSLSCREYLIYSDLRAETLGVHLIYRDGERRLLEPGDPGPHAVETYTSQGRQAVFHPDFGARVLEFSDTDVTWRSMDLIPAGRIFQTLFTQGVAYLAIVTLEPDGPLGEDRPFYRVWSVGRDLEAREVMTNPDPDGQVRLVPISPRADIVGIDMTFRSGRFVRISESGQETNAAHNIGLDGVVHVVKTSPYQGQRLSWIFRADETAGRLVPQFFGSPQDVPDFHPDAQANIVTWYDDAGNERVLLLGAGIGGPEQPRKLVELDLLHELTWETPLDLPLQESLGYMGTDQQGKTLVITSGDDELEDGLAVFATSEDIVDLEALKRTVGIAGPLRIKPLERENAGGTYRTAQPHRGWLLMFEGGATGKVWLTDGSAERTWNVDDDVTWAAFRAGAYKLVAHGANMAAVSYEKNGEQALALMGIESD